ncbi:MAG TPA: kelch repeat-containing protein [Candidatus Eisenbacteria bacterium]
MLMPSRLRFVLIGLLALALASPSRAARWVELSPADTTRPISRAAHSVVLDAPGRRLVAWGGRLPADEVWALPLDGPAIWARLRVDGLPPAARSIASTIFDPVRRRMVVFGGGTGEGAFPTSNEVWALSLDGTPRWRQLAPAGTPPDLRELHCAIYDPVRDRMLVFGGFSTVTPPYGTYENSVWELTLGDPPTWRHLLPTGVPPSSRVGASMVYDAAHDRAIVFGGNNPTDPGAMTYHDDVFELRLAEPPAWRPMTTTGTPPSPRYEQAMAMDDARGRMLVFGGRGYNVIPLADTWALDLNVYPPAWRQAGPDASFPRYHSVAILDPATDRLIVDGGFVGQGGGYYVDQTIALSLTGQTAWQVLDPGIPPSAPARRASPVPLLDPFGRQLIVEGGYDNSTFGAYVGYAQYDFPKDIWTWPLDSPSPRWTRVSATQPLPFLGPGRAVLDPVRRQQVRFFQDALAPNRMSSVGVLPLDGSAGWTPVIVSGVEPPTRLDFSTAYDPVRDRILLAGGYTTSSRSYTRTPRRDVWSLSLAGTPAWTMLRDDVPGGPVLLPEALFFDPAADQFLGVGYAEQGKTGTWSLAADGASPWQFVAPLGPAYGTVSFDPAVRELVSIDLEDGDALHHVLSDTAGWVPLEVAGEPPPGRYYSRVEFDPFHRRVLVFGGEARTVSGPLGDLWALELDRASPTVSVPGPDLVRINWHTNLAAGARVSAERRDAAQDWRALTPLAIDANGYVRLEDADVRPGLALDYRLRFNGTVLPGSEQHLTVAPRPALALAGARPNPAVGTASLVFTLTGPFPAKLELFDVSGRSVASRGVGGMGAGEHVLALEQRLAPGLYVAVLTQSGERLIRRFVVTR